MAVDRASATDRAFLAMDSGTIPEQIGVVLRLEPGALGLARVRELIDARVRAVPRLRQRLVRTPVGCGGPIWVDDPGFDVRRQVTELTCRAPGDEQALLDTALGVVMARLPKSAPLWSATVVTGLDDGSLALVVVLHHVLADGLGGLAVLTALTDDPGADAGRGEADQVDGDPVDSRQVATIPFPRPRPSMIDLARQAWGARVRAVGGLPRSWRVLRRTMSAGGGLRPAKAAGCSLNRRTGTRRAVAVVTVDRARLRAAAHRVGATTNDAVLVAVADALEHVLGLRGESVDPLVVTVPVSGRPPGPARDAAAASADGRDGPRGEGGQLGNLVSPLLVAVPTGGPVGERLARVGATVRAGKGAAAGAPPIAVLGWLFRPLARAGGFRFYLNHQHRFHTLVSHVRGPEHPVRLGGLAVRSAIPLAVGESGNQTVYFEVLSYADTLTVVAITDPDHFGELDQLADRLRLHLAQITDVDPRPRTG
jgi:WS/DGAT/MGAT family acyltransferase